MISEPILDLGVGFVWSCKGVCLASQSHGTQHPRCVCMGGGRGVCDVPHQIGEKVSDAIYVEALLNQVDAF